MTYVPKEFTKDGATVVSTSLPDEWRLLWLGYVEGDSVPVDRTKVHATLADLDEVLAAAGQAPTIFTQGTPAAQWMITHTLGGQPDVRLFLAGDPAEPVWTDVLYVDEATILVDWPSPESGVAFIG